MIADNTRNIRMELDSIVIESLGVDGFHRQHHWAVPMMWWEMTFGALGAGIYISGIFSNSWPVAVLGFMIFVVGKGLLLLFDLGRPERAWRVFARPGTSWIARGSWIFAVFGVSGVVALGLDWIASDAVTAIRVSEALSVLAAGVLLVYDGFFLMESKGVGKECRRVAFGGIGTILRCRWCPGRCCCGHGLGAEYGPHCNSAGHRSRSDWAVVWLRLLGRPPQWPQGSGCQRPDLDERTEVEFPGTGIRGRNRTAAGILCSCCCHS